MGMELLTQTNPQVLREFSQYLDRRALGAIQEIAPLNQAVRTVNVEKAWEGIGYEAFLRRWTEFHGPFREAMYVMTRAAATIERLADELTTAQDLYHKARLAALDAGFGLDAEGFIQMPADGATPAQTIEIGEISGTVNNALAEAEAADQRAARELGDDLPVVFGLFSVVRALVLDVAEPLTGATAAGLRAAGDGLERRERQLRSEAVARARAGRFGGLTKNPVFRFGARASAAAPILSTVALPFIYDQYVTEGDDPGLAATRTATSVLGQNIGGAIGAAGGMWVAAETAIVPPVAVAGAITLTLTGSEAGRIAGESSAPWVHRMVVTPIADGMAELGREISKVRVPRWWNGTLYEDVNFP